MFRAPFLAPSSGLEVSRVFLERAAQSPKGLPNSTAVSVSGERPHALGRLRVGLWLTAPSVSSPAANTTRPSPQGLYSGSEVMTCA